MSMPSGKSLRHSSKANRSPPACRNVSRPRMPSSSSVSMQSAEKPGAATAMRLTPVARIAGERRVGRRLQPFGAAEAATGTRHPPRAPAPRPAAARSSGNGNDRDRQDRACARGMPWKLSSSRSGAKSSAIKLALEVGGERVDVQRIIVVRRQRAQRRLPAHRCKRRRTPRHSLSPSSPRNIAGRAARRGCGCSPRATMFSTAARDARIAVAHGIMDADAGQALAQRLGLAMCDHPKRRTFVGPDLVIGFGRASRARAQDDPVKDRLPRERVDFDYPRVAEEFGEVAAHGARFRRVGRAEIDQQ